MKNILKSIIVLLLIVSCNSEAKKVTDGLLKEIDRMENEDPSATTELEKIENELLRKTPLTEEELLQAFPKDLSGLPLDEVSTLPNLQLVSGKFSNGKISISIADAAGYNNSIASSFLGNYGFVNASSEDRKFSKIERDGIKTSSEYDVSSNRAEMWLFFDNRYYISLTGHDMNPEELWQAFDRNALNGYKEMNK